MTALMRKIDLLTEIAWWVLQFIPFNRKPWFKGLIKSSATREKYFPAEILTKVDELQRKNQVVQVLDVGCGPLSRLAWGVEARQIQLVAMDPLAAVYNFLLWAFRIHFPVRPIVCSGEDLLSVCQPDSFDIVFSQNALDHSRDPGLCIGNIAKVLKKKGLFYLAGFTKEGTKHKWLGLHKHDFYLNGGDLIWSNQKGQMVNLSRAHGLRCVYQDKPDYGVGDWFYALFEK